MGRSRSFSCLLPFVTAGWVLFPCCSAEAQFSDAYVQSSIFLYADPGFATSGYGRFGYGYTGVPPEFSWGTSYSQPSGPVVAYGWGGFDIISRPDIAGYSVKNGTGVWEWGGSGSSAARVNLVIDGRYTWGGQPFSGVVSLHYVLQGRVGTHPGDRCEFIADAQYYTASSGDINLHLHYLNDQLGSTFSGVDLYAEAPWTFRTVNGNSTAEVDTFENTTFSVTDPGQGSLSGVGSMGAVAASSGVTPSLPPINPRPGSALNISTRMTISGGDNVLIGGFIVTGSDPKKVVIRALGPSLTPFGVPNALQDPVIELHDGTGAMIAFNNDWMDSQAMEIQSSGLAPSDNHEAAIVRTLMPGPYTAIVKGNGSTTGVGLVEVYDVDAKANSTLANISTRGFAGIADNVMIAGFILGPTGSDADEVIIRAIGPSLQQYGVTNPLRDPTLELHNGNGALIQSNDNWKQTQQAEIEASGLAPKNDLESAIAATLPAGNYTAIVKGADGGSGAALVEAYKLH